MATPQIRRIVTRRNDDGTIAVVTDAPADAVVELPQVPGTALVDLWRAETVPLPLTGDDDPTTGPFALMPAGALFRIIDLAPSDAEPMWHETPTVDLIYVAAGSARFLHDGGAVDLAAGDTIVVRGGRHAWVCPGPDPCRLVDVSIAAG